MLPSSVLQPSLSHFLLSYLYFCSDFLHFQEFYISFSLRRCLGLKKCFQELNVLGRDGCIKEEKDVILQQHVLCVYIHETFKLVLLHHQYPLHWLVFSVCIYFSFISSSINILVLYIDGDRSVVYRKEAC